MFLGIPLLILAAVLQGTLIPVLVGSNGNPNLVFLMVISWAVHGTLRQNVIWAFVGGITLDLLSILPIGTTVIPLMILAIFLYEVGDRFAGFGLLVMIGIALFGTIFYQITLLLLITLLGYRVSWLPELTSILIPTVFYNVILIVPIYGFVRRLQRRRTG
ncbi:MAG: rod shape-determining protein MreD [Anaerolineae bacterium]|jgi:rod shape-determining protein MreD|nr:rod shape-determining protein MreD [Anaerolineae bacterium]